MLNEVILISCLLPSIILSFPSSRDSTRDCTDKCISEGELPVCGNDNKKYYNLCALNCAKRTNKDLTLVISKSTNNCGVIDSHFEDIHSKVINKRNVPEGDESKDNESMVKFINYVLGNSRNGPSEEEQAIPNRFEYAIENHEPVEYESTFKSNDNIPENIWSALYALRKANKQLLLAKNARKSVINELDNIAMNLNAKGKKSFYDTATIHTNEVQTSPKDIEFNNHVLRYGSNYEDIPEEEQPTTHSEFAEVSISQSNRDDESSGSSIESNRQAKSLFSTENIQNSIHPRTESSSRETDELNANINFNHEDANMYRSEDSTTERAMSSENVRTKEDNNIYNELDIETTSSESLLSSSPKENDEIENDNNDETQDHFDTESTMEFGGTDWIEEISNKSDESKEEHKNNTGDGNTENIEALTTESYLITTNENDNITEEKDNETKEYDIDVKEWSSPNESSEHMEEAIINTDDSNLDKIEAPSVDLISSSPASDSVEQINNEYGTKDFHMDTTEHSVSDWTNDSSKETDETQADDNHSTELSVDTSDSKDVSTSDVPNTTMPIDKISELDSIMPTNINNEQINNEYETKDVHMDTTEHSVSDSTNDSSSETDETQADDSHSTEQSVDASESKNASTSDVPNTTMSIDKISEIDSIVSADISTEESITERTIDDSDILDKGLNDVTMKYSTSNVTPEHNINSTMQHTTEKLLETTEVISNFSSTSTSTDENDMKSNDSKSNSSNSFEETTPISTIFINPLNSIFIPHPVPEDSEDDDKSFSMYPGPVDNIFVGDESMNTPNYIDYIG